MEVRLQKYLAQCGLGSRRSCEELIREGKVQVDGETITQLGTKVDGSVQKVVVLGEPVRSQRHLYFAVHKPKGVVCTHSDPSGRPRAVDLVPVREERVFPVGRLDEESEGLLLLTNDGELANRIAHPRYGVPKTYRVVVKGEPDHAVLEKIRHGVHLAEGKTSPAKVLVQRKSRLSTTLLITLDEGRNREVRRILAKVGIPVKKLLRVRVGPIHLGTLKRGEWRRLTRIEIDALRDGRTSLPRRKAGSRPSARKKNNQGKTRTGHGLSGSHPRPRRSSRGGSKNPRS